MSNKALYEGDGFFIKRDALDLASMTALRQDIERLFLIHSKEGEDVFATCSRLNRENQKLLYLIYQCVARTLTLDALKLKCLEYIKNLYPERTYITVDSVVLFGLPDDSRLAYAWHQESNYMPGIKDFVNFWFPVFESGTEKNGAMSVLAGSHKLGTLPYVKSKSASNSYTNLVPVGIEEIAAKHKEFLCQTDPGDLVVFHPDLIHRSNTNLSGRTRFSGVIRIAALEALPERLIFSSEDY